MKERKYWSGKYITKLESNQVFVFGSNPKGSHGAGAAKTAIDNFGAIKGKGRGLMGQSYGLVTKNLKWDIGFYEKETGITYDKGDYKSVSPEQISNNVLELYECARNNPNKEFFIVYQNEKWPNGQGKKSLNGYYPLEMLDFMIDNKEVPNNIVFHDSYKKELEIKFSNNITKPIINTTTSNDPYNTILHSKINRTIVPFFTQFDPLSQWHPSKFQYKDFNFISAEQFMMFSKAKLFKDEIVSEKIMELNGINFIKDFLSGKLTTTDLLSNNNPNEYLNDQSLRKTISEDKLNKIEKMHELWSAIQSKIKSYGKEVTINDGIPWNEKLWVDNREKIIYAGSKLKYSQNECLKNTLMLNTNALFVEAAKNDKIYGVGLSKNDPRILEPSQWQGLNLLGKALTNLQYNFAFELNKKTKPYKSANKP